MFSSSFSFSSSFPNRHNSHSSVLTSLRFIKEYSLSHVIGGHLGCINVVLFNQEGNLIVTGSDDMTIQLHDIFNKKLKLKIQTLHRGNIFDIKEIPETNCHQFLSCAGDGRVLLTTISESSQQTTKMIHRHKGRSHRLKFAMDNTNICFSSGEDGYCYLYDLRDNHNFPINSTFQNDLPPRHNCIEFQNEYHSRRSIYSIDINPLQPHHIAIGGDTYSAKVYDIRNLSSSQSLTSPVSEYYPSHLKDDISIYSGISGLQYHRTGRELLVSHNNDGIYRFDLKQHNKLQNNNNNNNNKSCDEDDKNNNYLTYYQGHQNVETIKQVTYLSSCDSIYDFEIPQNRDYVLSGSDCGHIFIWDSETGSIVKVLIGSLSNPVNCITPHKDYPLIATSGIERTVKLWYPYGEKGWFGGSMSGEFNSINDMMKQHPQLSEKERIEKEEREENDVKLLEEEYISILLGNAGLEIESSSSDSESLLENEESKVVDEDNRRDVNIETIDENENKNKNNEESHIESLLQGGSRRRSHSEMIDTSETTTTISNNEQNTTQEFRRRKLRLRNYVLEKFDELFVLDRDALEREGVVDSDSDIYFDQEESDEESDEIESESEEEDSESDEEIESESDEEESENDSNTDSTNIQTGSGSESESDNNEDESSEDGEIISPEEICVTIEENEENEVDESVVYEMID